MRTQAALDAQRLYDVKLIRLAQKGDAAARAELLDNVKNLVWKFAGQYSRKGLTTEDLAQEGFCGALKAIDKFDEAKEVNYCTYAGHWIRCSVMNAVTYGLTRYEKEVFFHGGAIAKALFNSGIEPTYEKIAEKLGVEAEYVGRVHDKMLDSKETDLFQQDNRESPEDYVIRTSEEAFRRRTIKKALRQIDPRQAEIVKRTVMDDPLESLEDIAQEWGLSRERIRQLRVKGMVKLKKCLKALNEEASA